MQGMRRFLVAAVLVVIFGAAPESAHAYRLTYKEQIYDLVHQQLSMRPENYAENIGWLELALKADFANPLYARAEIANAREWELYRDLFWMHLNLALVDQYLGWASDYFKFVAYFYNYPWRDDNLESLVRAESLFGIALYYWDEAVRWSAEASRFPWMSPEEIQYWEDQSYRIQTGELDYKAIIGRHMTKLQEVREAFQKMDSTTY
ncbi:MAG: hypothetical protein E4H09_02150 [Spirochaetales bacterium]|nr:MAG: hypothetical protein E4H09_02150 [Spirochaetales bacterium]